MQLIKIVFSVFLVAIIAMFGSVEGQTLSPAAFGTATADQYGTIRDSSGAVIYLDMTTPSMDSVTMAKMAKM